MNKLLPFLLTLSLSAQEVVHKTPHKDLVITVHQENDSPEPKNTQPKSCCRSSDCDIRLKIAILMASVSMATAISSTVVAIYYKQSC